MSAQGCGAFYRLVRRILKALPVDAAGRRVLDETLADWRCERGNAHSVARRLTVTLRNGVAAARGLLMVSIREVTQPKGAVVLLRLSAWVAVGLLASLALNWELLYVTAPSGGALYGYDSLVFLSVLPIAGLMPLLAFLSAACVRRTESSGSRLGPALVMGMVMLLVFGWAMPAAGQAFREITFARSGGTGPVPPGFAELSFAELIASLWSGNASHALIQLNQKLLWVIAVPVMLTLGASARSFTGWRRFAATALPLLMFFVPVAAGLSWPNEMYAYWGVLAAAVLLVRMLAGAARNQHTKGDGLSAVERSNS